jgi:hypothetical protein
MIWFACKQCGKLHHKDDSQVGTLIFCGCGFGNRVPWSSTVPVPAEAEQDPAPPREKRRPTRPAPLPPRVLEEEEEEDLPPRKRAEAGVDVPTGLPPARPPRFIRRPNPQFCFHHDEQASETTCSACHLSFCSACVATIQGQTLCGPCKNFRIRGLHRPTRTTHLSIFSLVLGLVSGPVTLFLTIMALGSSLTPEGSTGASVLMCLLAIALPIGALVMGALALREINARPHVSGRALALTGICASASAICWGIALAELLIAKSL